MDSAGNFEACLNFLRGNTDEQRLVGLLLATKYVQGDDKESILKVFDAIGIQFINRLLRSGTRVQVMSHESKEQEQAYLQLALSILSAFCRVPELASLDEVINKIPMLLDLLKGKPVDPIVADCFESLLGIGSSSTKGLLCLQQSRALSIVSEYLCNSAADTVSFRSSVRLMQLLLGGTVPEQEISESADNIKGAISVLAKLLASEQGSLKFEALWILQSLCSPKILVQICRGKDTTDESIWLGCIRMGIGQILQSRVVANQKHLALELIASLVEFFGGTWLLGPEEATEPPADRFFVLLVETLRVETAVLLNEVARVRFDPEFFTTWKSEESVRRQHILAICYSLLENVMTFIIEKSEDVSGFSENTVIQTANALNETISTVFEFLQDAKRQSIRKGDDLIAAARLIGRYLADAPSVDKTHRKQFLMLLEYLLSISSEYDESYFLTLQFLLPAICDVTMDKEGCKALVSWGGHKQVIDCMLAAIQAGQTPSTRVILKACDVILNLLQKENRLVPYLMPLDFLPVITFLPSWAVNTNEIMEISMAACICVMVLDLSSEGHMLQMISMEVLSNVYDLIITILDYFQRSETSLEPAEEEDLWEVTISASSGLMDRYPSLKDAIRSSSWLQNFLHERSLTEAVIKNVTVDTCLQSLLMSLLDD